MSTPEIPHLTEDDIRRCFDDGSFARGASYHRQGAISSPRRVGSTLKAECQGSQPQPYHVEVTLGPEGIVAGDCSCPIGAGGGCKHTAALLLTWLAEPNSFTEIEGLEAALERRSKTELIALIREMLAREPDLELLLELPIPGGAEVGQPIDPQVIARQVNRAFAGAGREWNASYGVADELRRVVNLGDACLQRDERHNAMTIYQEVIQGILHSYGQLRDEEGELGEVVNGCVESLRICLAGATDPAQREQILLILWDTYRWDVDYGGIDMGYPAPGIILSQATPEERQRVATWVRAALPAERSSLGDWRLQTLGGLLLNLEQGTLDDEAYIRICRETRRMPDLVDRLLALDRMEEAIAEARQVSDYDLIRLADLFVKHTQMSSALALVRERTRTSRDTRLAGWLQDRAEEQGDWVEALMWSEKQFWDRPSLVGYEDLKRLAQRTGGWASLFAQITERLAVPREYALLTEIYLQEDQIGQAIQILGQTPYRLLTWGGSPLAVQVAKAAEESRPQDAIHLYMNEVRSLIASQGRPNYAMAASHLQHIREILCLRLGQEAAWKTLIAQIREQNRRLRTLKEELNKAGL